MFKPVSQSLIDHLIGEATLILISEKNGLSLPNLLNELHQMATVEKCDTRKAAFSCAINDLSRFIIPLAASKTVSKRFEPVHQTEKIIH
ncbi:hypothetical protein ACRQ84_23240 (plasmid) [Enterobacter ludwigii]